MIQGFPNPFPDEVLYSLIARFSWQSLNDSPKELSRQLFGDETTKATIDLPSHLNSLFERVRLSRVKSVDEIINTLTLFPFYRPLMVEKKRTKVLESMKGNSGGSLHTRVGINASKIIRPRHPKCCPVCFSNDLKNYGQSYWHRIHQIPDITVCPFHNVFVLDYTPGISELNYSYYLPPPVKFIPHWKTEENSSELILKIANQFNQLLEGASGFDINKVDYITRIEAKGYLDRGRINRDSLFINFKNFILNGQGESLFLKVAAPEYWLWEIIKRPTHIFHPLRHVLVTEFLNHEIQPPKTNRKSVIVDGPWKCRNKAAEHYGESVIEKISTHTDRKSKREISVMTCSCGMVYTRSLVHGEDNYRIIEWGEVWNNLLKSCIKQKKSFRETARILGTDAKTVSKYSKGHTRAVKIVSAKLLSSKRSKWERLLKQFDNSKVQNVRYKNPALYTWLYRHDKEWLQEFNRKNKTQRTINKPRLNWAKRDEEISQMIAFQFKKLTVINPRARLTKSLLAKHVGHEKYLLRKTSRKLPKSVACLKNLCESVEQFQIRRIRLAAASISDSGQRLVEWRIIRRACLRKPISASARNEIQILLSR